MMKTIKELCIGNYYGELELVFDEDDDKYYLALGNYDNDYYCPISEHFAKEVLKEFENKTDDDVFKMY